MPRVLLVDDDPLVRSSSAVLLAAQGYKVALAPDGHAAIAMVEASSFDLAIVDFFMPRMNGLDLIKAVHAIRPTLPTIIMSVMRLPGMSGDSLGVESSNGQSITVTWLQKPFRSADLSRAIAQATGIAPDACVA